MTAAYLTALVVGGLAVLSTLVVSHFIGSRDGDGPPFRVLGKEAGLIAAGAGGLIGAWAAALPKSTRVYITAVDDEFVHVSSAREL